MRCGARWLAGCGLVLSLLIGAVQANPAMSEAIESAAPWPTQGRIIYRIYHGDSGIQIGRTTHTWWHDADRYWMESLVETTGLAALLKDFRYQQRSEGSVTAQGLRPERFSVDQRGKPPQEALFDWVGGQVRINRGDSKRQAPLVAGDQDILSIAHQLSQPGAPQAPVVLTVVNNKSAAVAKVRDMGEATVRLPLGQMRTRHFSVRSDDGNVKIEIWLAAGQHWLPVRIRIENRKGEILDQQAEHLVLGEPAQGNPS
ncbi:MAG TPA: DUF3108 domain-containing protein [Denitromonas sp.]|uniref:DUF3108 domain-containing protein n=1 Tax=Denitromonas sp. TaxID=2734609 RepID=UPI001E0CAA62|nr:DUF3108 domain-containing protein [Rhodocyclaceae bacterium]MCP5220974.1 DUF3108 domain-containing protein [Zoogloeaceae bacterium]HPR07769.1 DUF3108 domain-containing protein [Denitromonas sp.]HQU90164.1 DUF3108 domain-containing protein [Denitromonas sp.]HQV16372.1 DUF3108 domain-containing protein [Denitromonas sp.]